MNKRTLLIACAATAVVFLAIDAVWLTLMADRLYRPALGHLMIAGGFEPVPALLFYAVYIAGVVGFVVAPALAAGRPAFLSTLGRGAAFGFVCYATYDLTNQATLRDWPWAVTLADLCWGSFATGFAAAVSSVISSAIAAHRRSSHMPSKRL